MFVYTRLNTKSDSGGNPRRVLIVKSVEPGMPYAERVAVITYSYSSAVEALTKFGYAGAVQVGEFAITPSEYRVYTKLAAEKATWAG